MMANGPSPSGMGRFCVCSEVGIFALDSGSVRLGTQGRQYFCVTAEAAAWAALALEWLPED